MSSGSKKRRTESEGDVEKELLDALIQICADMNDSSIILTPLKIECCNATSSHAASFSKAFCDTKPYDTRVLFGDVFRNGISILRDFEVSKKIPKEKQTLFVFNKLMDLLKGDRRLNLSDPLKFRSMSGTELTVLVANHLLGKLATSSCYLVDKNCNAKKGDQCFCGEDSCTMTGTYGDTSIGNPEVWHGNLDIIINNDLAVESLDEQPDTPETPGEKSPVEVKLKASLIENPQIIAQTIVFSFLQKKRHPNRDHFLTPCIGIGSSELIVMLYDSEHDVLLESSTIPLFENELSCRFSYCAILVCWLTVNYRYFCSGLTERYKMFKSNFFNIAREKINVYEHKLQFRNVRSSNFPKLIDPPVKVKAYISSFMHETHKMLFENYAKLNKSDEESSSEINESDSAGS